MILLCKNRLLWKLSFHSECSYLQEQQIFSHESQYIATKTISTPNISHFRGTRLHLLGFTIVRLRLAKPPTMRLAEHELADSPAEATRCLHSSLPPSVTLSNVKPTVVSVNNESDPKRHCVDSRSSQFVKENVYVKSRFGYSTSLYTRPFPKLDGLRRQMAPLNQLQAANKSSSTHKSERDQFQVL